MTSATIKDININIKAKGDQAKREIRTIRQLAAQAQAQEAAVAKASIAKQKATLQKAEKDKTAIAKDGASAREKAREKEFRRLEAETRRWHQKELREAAKQASQLEAIERKRAASRQATLRSIGGGAFRGLGNGVGNVLRAGGTLAALAGGLSVGDSLTTGVRNQGIASQIALNSTDPNSGKQQVSAARVYKESAEAAKKFGLEQSEVLAGLDSFIAKSGKADKAFDFLPDLLEIATATGANLDELSTAAGLILNTNKNMSREQLSGMLRGSIAQGRLGAIDTKEQAKTLGIYGAQAGLIGGDLGKNFATLQALGQMAVERGGATSGDQAATDIERLVAVSSKNQAKFSAMGIQTISKDNKFIDPTEVMFKAFEKTKGSVAKLTGHGGVYSDIRAQEAVRAPLMTWNETYQEELKKGTKQQEAARKATEAARKAVMDYAGATVSAAAIKKQSDERLAQTDKKIAVAMEQLRQQVAEKLLPLMPDLIDKFQAAIPTIVKVVEKLGEMAGWAIENPKTTVATYIAAEMAKGFAPAVIQGVLSGGFSGVTTVGSIGGAAGVTIGSLAIASALVVAAAAALESDENPEAKKKDEDREKAAQDAADDIENLTDNAAAAYQAGDTEGARKILAERDKKLAALEDETGKLEFKQSDEGAYGFWDGTKKNVDAHQLRLNQEILEKEQGYRSDYIKNMREALDGEKFGDAMVAAWKKAQPTVAVEENGNGKGKGKNPGAKK